MISWPLHSTLRLCAALLLGLLLAAAGSLSARAACDLSNSDTYRLAQDYMLRRINEERSKAGAGWVSYDASAAQAARSHAEDMLANSYFSHWGLDGRKPTRRWNLMGGYDAIAENIYYKKGDLGDMETMLEDAMQTLLDSPGHRKTLLNPEHTNVGIGFAMDERGKQIYIAQEFITKLGGAYFCPLYARVGEQAELTGRFDSSLYKFEALVLGYEELPLARDRRWLSNTSEYSNGDKLYAGFTPTDSRLKFNELPTTPSVEVDPQGGYFKATPKLDYKKQPGTYYLFVWLRDKRSDTAVLAAMATVEVKQ